MTIEVDERGGDRDLARAHVSTGTQGHWLIHLNNRVLPAIVFLLIHRPVYVKLAQLFREGAPWLTLLNRSLTAVFVTLILILFLVRRERTGERSSLRGSVVAVLGTFSVILFALNSGTEPRESLLGIAAAIQLAGLTWTILSLVYLGRSFGILPEARDLVRHGPYRVVRHPLYLGELVMIFGAMLPVISPIGLSVWLFAAAMQIWRTVHEERALKRAFPEAYGEYAAQTRRLIPMVW